MQRFWLLVLNCIFIIGSRGQGMIQLKGVVYDADSNQVLDSVTIIVKHSSRIIQNKADGSFSIFVKPTDTLIFGLYGFRVKYLCFKDSLVIRDYLNLRVGLSHLHENIREVVISRNRTQKEIRLDIERLAYDRAYANIRSNALQSPITKMYDQYSHKSKTKKLLRDYEFQIAKNNLIKQLLDIYNKQGIIDIAPDAYKAFIESLDLDWDFLITASDYDLALYIKRKAMEWKN